LRYTQQRGKPPKGRAESRNRDSHRSAAAKTGGAETTLTKNKLYSLHEPEVDLVSKRKARVRYAFGTEATAADLRLDGVERGDAPERLFGHGRAGL
jgi:hypothetical protein